ncbi:hypothetical protein PO909_014289 [Leuciscus waleckii]
MRTVFVIYLLVTLLQFVLCCEELTHYRKNDKCCKKCGPGKRMLLDDNCEDPRCQDCQIGEYQSGYTTNTKCERQPSCDPNLHLKPQEDKLIITKLNKCVCEDGYYCTQDDDCSTCIEHSVCKPGQRVAKKGSPDSDTVCEACKNGTFSTHDSADTCKEWTKCEPGYDESSPGSSTSDRSCIMGARGNRVVIIGVLVAVLVLAVFLSLGVFFYKSKRNKGWKEFTPVKQDIACLNIKPVHQEEADVERADRPLQQPEEDIDSSIPVSPTPSNMTENGNVVDQEHGKEHIISSTESNAYSYS